MNQYGGWIDVVPKTKVDVKKLIGEFKINCENLITDVVGTNAVLVQKKFHLMLDNMFSSQVDLSLMPYTLEMAELAKSFVTFNSITYRYVMPNTCYNWHTDPGKNCIHIPLITNPGSWFVYENRCFHMPSNGSIYLVNNLRPHSFMNSGKEPRLHLTFEFIVI
jgi:hypothetical protein